MTRHRHLPQSRVRATKRRLEIESFEQRVLMSAGSVLAPLAFTNSHCNDIGPDANEMIVMGDPTGGGSNTSGGPTFAPSAVPQLSSLPGASASIYLNFLGDYTAQWGGYGNITTPAYDIDGDPNTFSQTELDNINKIWRYVSEDYAPFNINVTTVTPATFGDKITQQVDIGGNGSWTGGNYGGISYIGGFSNSASNISFVFPNNLGNGNPKYVGDACSHEAGHGFGLVHQSQYDANGNKIADYYKGPGDGTAPIMGNSYDSFFSRWWKGTSANGPNQIQDDMAIIANSTNGFGYRDDSTGNSIASANALVVVDGQVSGSGVINTDLDKDYWSFTTNAGQITLNVNVAAGVNNLWAKLELVDSNGNVIASNDPTSGYNASITTNVQAGTYYLIAESHGGYGDAGQYTISGSIQQAIATVPNTPTGVAATAGDSQVSLTWIASSGATSYNIYRSLTAGGEGATAYRTGVTSASFTDAGLTNGQTYYYKVTAVNSAGESGQSSETSATPKHAAFSLAIDSGGRAAGSFVADTDVTGGRKSSTHHAIDTTGATNPAPQVVYQSERYGNFTYTIPNLTAGQTYTVRLHFAEIYMNQAGSRLFNVKINGSQVLTNFDIFASAGGKYKAIVREFTATADANGNITIQYVNVKDNAKSSGIEILSTAGSTTAAAGPSQAGTVSRAAQFGQNLGSIAQFLGNNPSYSGWSNWANTLAHDPKALQGFLAQWSANTMTQKTLENLLGGQFHLHGAHVPSSAHASSSWTDDLLVQLQL